MSTVRPTLVGGPTVLLEVDGWRILTDPTFDPPGGSYAFGLGTSSRQVSGPAIPAGELGPIDAALLSHHDHGDNLDAAGLELLAGVGTVVTTEAGARELGGGAVGLVPWATHRQRLREQPVQQTKLCRPPHKPRAGASEPHEAIVVHANPAATPHAQLKPRRSVCCCCRPIARVRSRGRRCIAGLPVCLDRGRRGR